MDARGGEDPRMAFSSSGLVMSALPDPFPDRREATDRADRGSPDRGSPGPARFILWIDNVGGFLACRTPSITIGRSGTKGIDIPLLGDVASRHAQFVRDGEGFVLEAWKEVRVNRQPLVGRVLLPPNAELDFGSGVIFDFRQPHALSMSAWLKPRSAHRLRPTVDAVLLFADTLIVGPAVGSHVQCPDWEQELVFYQMGMELGCRSSMPFRVHGGPPISKANLDLRARIESETVSLSLEPC